ncbi:MAG: hypothetical protein AABZ47_00620 [Planctomycetota bacterium]
MPTVLSAIEYLQRDFLEIRTRILDIGAAFDRMDRASDAAVVRGDPRSASLRSALALLCDDQPEKARRIQLAFSDPFDSDWRQV